VRRRPTFGKPEWEKKIGKSDPEGYNDVGTYGLEKVRAPPEFACRCQSGEPNMSEIATLEPLLEGLSQERLRQLIAFARFLAAEDERDEWQSFGKAQLARAYGTDEPDYSELDLKARSDT
jgi:hypothetical protein